MRTDSIMGSHLAERQHFCNPYEQILNDLQSAGNAGEYYTPRAVTSFMGTGSPRTPVKFCSTIACGIGGFLTCPVRHMRERYVKKPEHELAMQSALRTVEKKPLPKMLASPICSFGCRPDCVSGQFNTLVVGSTARRKRRSSNLFGRT